VRSKQLHSHASPALCCSQQLPALVYACVSSVVRLSCGSGSQPPCLVRCCTARQARPASSATQARPGQACLTDRLSHTTWLHQQPIALCRIDFHTVDAPETSSTTADSTPKGSRPKAISRLAAQLKTRLAGSFAAVSGADSVCLEDDDTGRQLIESAKVWAVGWCQQRTAGMSCTCFAVLQCGMGLAIVA
jgi:hypothetical protein